MSTTLALALQLTAVNGISGVLSKIQNGIFNLGGASKSVKRDFDAMNASLAKGLSALATHSYLKSKLQPGVQAAADMQEAMLKVEGNIKTTTMSAGMLAKQLKEVRDTAFDVSKAAPMSQKDVVDIQNALLKAGVDIGSITGSRGAAWAATGLSTLSEVDPGQVGDLLARIGKQYQFKGNEYGSASDTLMRGEAASPGNLQEIMYSLRQFGTNAHLLGIPFKDAVAASAALTSLGGEAGTAMNRFLEDSTGKTPHQQKALKELGLGKGEGKNFKSAFFEGGKYIGLERSIAKIRERLSLIKDDSVKIRLATKAWGEEGARAALIFANAKPEDSFEGMIRQMDDALGIEERMEIRMRGLNMQTKALAGTIQSSLAVAFDPILDRLAAASAYKNDLVASAGKWAGEHPKTSGWVAGGATAAVAGVGAYGLAQLLKGGWHGSRMLKGLATGGAALAGGIAEGKAVQAATGVVPVFVTNFAQMNGGSAPNTAANTATDLAATAAASAAAPGLLKSVATGAKWIAHSTLPEIAALGTGAMAAAGAMVAAAGLLGYGAGTVINKAGFEGSDAQNTLGGVIAQIMANFGNKEAKQALEINLHLDGQQITAAVESRQKTSARRN